MNVRCLFHLAVSATILGFSQLAVGQRPSTVQLVPGSVEIRNVTYSADTTPDLTKAAAGSGELVVLLGSVTYTKPGVTFTNLISDAAGKLVGVKFNLDQPFQFSPSLGLKVTIPTGEANVFADGRIVSTAKGTISTPFRQSNGDPIEVDVNSFAFSGANQAGSILCTGIAFKGAAASEGIQLTSLRLKAPTADFQMSWGAQGVNAWKFTLPQGVMDVAIPGVATTPKYPLSASVTNLSIDQDGKVDCPEVAISNRSTINFPDIAGVKVTVKGGTLTVKNSKPAVSNLRVDVTLPPAILPDDGNPNQGQNNPGSGGNNRPPLNIPDGANVIVRVENGITIEFPDPIAFKVGKTKLTAQKVFIDLSTSLFGAGAPAKAVDPKWKGVWLPSGTVTPPLGTGAPALSYTNFLIEPNGLSGEVRAKGLSFKAEGFDINPAEIGLTFSQNILVAGDVAGKLVLPKLGTLPFSAEFSENGDARFSVTNGALDIEGIGLTLEKINAQLDPAGLVIGGDLTFKKDFVTKNANLGMPQVLAGTKFSIQGLKVGPDGSFTLPREGGITLGEPVRIELGPCVVEIRGVSFTASNNEIDSVTFAGSASLVKAIEGLPATGELDFEGMKVSKRRGDDPFALGGFGFKAEIPQLGTISASLYRKNIDSFGDTLYGDAELRLTCLGTMASGIGLEFLLAPKGGDEPPAWFLGGSVEVPPILVQVVTPATTVPLFNINGFSGGFGLNVLPRVDGVGRISQPDAELKYSKGPVLTQVGLLMSDPVSSGRVWWADTALTFTFNPVIIDLTSRMVFLDPEGAKFLNADEWREKDRIARVYMALDTSKPRFVVGGDADLNFPTRAASLFSVSGALELFVAPNDQHLFVGWADGGQKPVTVKFMEVVKNYIDLKGTFGMALDFTKGSGTVFLDADAKMKVGGVEIVGGLGADLKYVGLGTSGWSLSGTASLDATADFGFFFAQVDADLKMSIAKDIRLDGQVSGRAGPFEGLVPIHFVIKR